MGSVLKVDRQHGPIVSAQALLDQLPGKNNRGIGKYRGRGRIGTAVSKPDWPVVGQAVQLVREKEPNDRHTLTEASGGITLENVRAYAEAGADLISIGALTHSAPAVDISFKIKPA